jgi:predicted GNAT family acetyltransferase
MMIIQHKEEGNSGTFYIEDKGEVIAEMTYQKDKNKMVIDHTEVDESLRGKNVGYELVERGVEYAREAHLRIVPICKFAKSVIERTEKFQDVL